MTEQTLKCERIKEDLSEFDLCFKIIVIGDCGVGKSCLSIKAIKDYFEELYQPTIGFEFLSFNLKIDDKTIKLQIWDTCGQETYRSLINGFYKSSSLAILVYSIDNEDSYKNLETWLNDIKIHSNPDIKIILIANKVDLEDKRAISKEKGETFCDEHNLNFFMETSAKTGFNAENLFMEAGLLLYKEYIKNKDNIVNRQNSIFNSAFMTGILDPVEEEINRERKKRCAC